MNEFRETNEGAAVAWPATEAVSHLPEVEAAQAFHQVRDMLFLKML
jgi:hypothetical protein